VHYAVDLFEASTAREIGRDFTTGLASLAAGPDRPVSQLGHRSDQRGRE
jgi:hypothetical protein